jgi:hypothetical protein
LERYLDRIFGRISGRYLIGCYHLRGQQPARSAVRRPRPPPEGEQASRLALDMYVKSRWFRIS